MDERIQYYVSKIWQCRSSDDYDHADQLFKEAMDHEQAKPPLERGEILRVYSQIKRDQGNLQEALSLLEKSYALLRPVTTPLRHAHIVRHIAELQSELKLNEEAEENYKIVIDIHHREGDIRSLNYANAARSYAVFCETMKKKDKALPFWKEAKEIYRRQDIHEGVKECDDHINSN